MLDFTVSIFIKEFCTRCSFSMAAPFGDQEDPTGRGGQPRKVTNRFFYDDQFRKSGGKHSSWWGDLFVSKYNTYLHITILISLLGIGTFIFSRRLHV